MAQLSKKDFIADKAMPLFLENGFKGTSIDMVVKSLGVSKPTVYKHFPNKANLLTHVIQYWLNHIEPPTLQAQSENDLHDEILQRWLTEHAIKLYGLFLGEGERAPDAALLFKSQFDEPWRKELEQWAKMNRADYQTINANVSHIIVKTLL